MNIKTFCKTFFKYKFAIFLFTACLVGSPGSFAKDPLSGVEKQVEGILKKLLGNPKFLESLLNPALAAAKLPNLKDLKTTTKCMPPTAKALKKLIELMKKNPLDPAITALLEKIKEGECRKEISTLADDCQGPGVLAATMTPAGGLIAGVCGQITAMDGEIDTIIAQAEQAQAQAKAAKKIAKAVKNKDMDGATSAIKEASNSGADDEDEDNSDDDTGDDDDSGDDDSGDNT